MIEVRMKREENAVKLAAFLAEKLTPRKILPIIKDSTIVFDEEFAEHPLEIKELQEYVKEGLSEMKISHKSIEVQNEKIIIEDFSGKDKEVKGHLLVCPHCGFVTPYEEIYWIHVKIHYV